MTGGLFDPDNPPAGQVRAHRDAEAGEVERDKAIERAARSKTIGLLEDKIEEVARAQATLTGDDVWAALGDQAETIGEGRAMGPAFKRAQRRGQIEPTSLYQPSDRPGRHRGPVRVWRSRIVVF